MGPCLSATSLIYVVFGTLLVIGTFVFVRRNGRAMLASPNTVD